MHAAGVEGFEWFRTINSLESLRQLVRQDSTEAGLHRCCWADHFAVVKTLDKFNMKLLILDDVLMEEGGCPFVVRASNEASCWILSPSATIILLR